MQISYIFRGEIKKLCFQMCTKKRLRFLRLLQNERPFFKADVIKQIVKYQKNAIIKMNTEYVVYFQLFFLQLCLVFSFYIFDKIGDWLYPFSLDSRNSIGLTTLRLLGYFFGSFVNATWPSKCANLCVLRSSSCGMSKAVIAVSNFFSTQILISFRDFSSQWLKISPKDLWFSMR